MERDERIEARIAELNGIFSRLPKNRQILLRPTIETVATMDIQLEDLAVKIADGTANTPDKQLYSSVAKTRDTLMRRLIAEAPADDEDDTFDAF